MVIELTILLFVVIVAEPRTDSLVVIEGDGGNTETRVNKDVLVTFTDSVD